MPRNNADQLNDEFGDLMARLEVNRPEAPKMTNDAKAALRTHLIVQYSDRRRSARLIPISLALVVMVSMIGLLIWFTSPRPVSAAEIMQRASLAATNASAFGLKSYTGTKIIWWNNTNEPGKLTLNMQEHIWAKMPNLLRIERYSYPAELAESLPTPPILPDPATPVKLNAIFVNDGSTAWWYNVLGKYMEKHIPAYMPVPSVSTDFQETLRKLEQDNDNVTQVGTENVAGREAYILSFTPKVDGVVLPNSFQIKVWIDKQTYIKLGEEYQVQKGAIAYKWQYSEFKPNVNITPEMFTFTPPPNVSVVDLRTPKDEADLAFAWRVLALSAEFKVFRPINIPTHLTMERPHVSGGVFSYSVPQLEQEFYALGEDLPALVLFEDQGIKDRPVIGTPVKIDGYDGHYYEEGGRRTLQVARDGTWIFLQANQRVMTKDELFQIARTMELVPKS
jgi:outer membrane lipoprotein-sorting protein